MALATMLIRFGFEAVSTAAIKKIELVEGSGDAAASYQVTYLTEEVETFQSAYDVDEQFATPVPAPPGFYVVDRETARREQVLAFLVDPLTARTAAPVPVTATGSCHLDGTRGLLTPDGRVSTIVQTFESYAAFAAGQSGREGMDGSCVTLRDAPASGSPFPDGAAKL
jgi:hypothetical protein